MISKSDIENLGWTQKMISSNGGTVGFTRGDELYVLTYNGDNFIYKKDCDPRLTEISIYYVNPHPLEKMYLYKGNITSIEKLKKVINEFTPKT